jgi:hypothetical protein
MQTSVITRKIHSMRRSQRRRSRYTGTELVTRLLPKRARYEMTPRKYYRTKWLGNI